MLNSLYQSPIKTYDSNPRISRRAIDHIKKLIVVLLLISCQNKPTDSSLPKAKAGKMFLTEAMFQNQTSIKLDGEWDFYYQKLLSSEEIKKQFNIKE